MTDVKVFRVTGELQKPNLRTTFKKEVRALKPENAKEKILKELGSRHRAKRFQIKITRIEEISSDEIKNLTIKKLTLGTKADVE